MSRLVAALALGLALLTTGSAGASNGAESSAQDIIQARQSGFKKMGAAMKSIAEQLKTDAPDLAKMTAAAQVIAAGSADQPNWFPAGSGPESGFETDALPHIWKDTSKFTALSGQLAVESGHFTAAMASKDVAAIRTQFKVLAEVCAGCHKSFRAD
jgi:cytochrome c556